MLGLQFFSLLISVSSLHSKPSAINHVINHCHLQPSAVKCLEQRIPESVLLMFYHIFFKRPCLNIVFFSFFLSHVNSLFTIGNRYWWTLATMLQGNGWVPAHVGCLFLYDVIIAIKIRAYLRSVYFAWVPNTMKPPNKGHIGDGLVVPCREVVLFLEVFF